MGYGILIDMAANVARLQSDMERGVGIVASGAGKMQKAVALARNALSILGGGFGVGVLVNALVGVVKQLDDLDEAAQAAGVSTGRALYELQAAARESGVGVEALDKGLVKLNVKMVDAASGGERAAATFRAMGVNVKDANGNLRSTEAVLADVADKFRSYRDGAEKSALAVELFSKGGAKLVPYLNQGSDALRRFNGLTDEMVEDAKLAQKEIDRLALAWDRLKFSVTGAVAKLVLDKPFPIEMQIGTLNDAIKVAEADAKRLGKVGAEQLPLLTRWMNNLLPPAEQTGVTHLQRLRAHLEGLKSIRDDVQGLSVMTVAPMVGDVEAEVKRAAAAQKLIDKFRELASLSSARLALGRDMTAAEKEYVKALDDHTSGVQRLNVAELTQLAVQASRAMANDKELAAAVERERLRQAEIESNAQLGANMAEELESLNAMVAARTDEVAMIGATAEQVFMLRQARLDEQIAHLEGAKATFEISAAEIKVIELKIALLRQLRGLNAAEFNRQREDTSFGAGFEKSWQAYKDNAANYAAQAADLFSTSVKGMEDVFVEFVQTGKLSFRSLINDLNAMLLRFAFRQMMMQLMQMMVGAGGGNFSMGGFTGAAGGGVGIQSNMRSGPIGNGAPVGKMGGSTIVVNNTYNIDSRTDRAAIAQDMEANRVRTIASISDMMRRNSPALQPR